MAIYQFRAGMFPCFRAVEIPPSRIAASVDCAQRLASMSRSKVAFCWGKPPRRILTRNECFPSLVVPFSKLAIMPLSPIRKVLVLSVSRARQVTHFMVTCGHFSWASVPWSQSGEFFGGEEAVKFRFKLLILNTMPKRRLELPRGLPHMNLNHARLPVPPLGQLRHLFSKNHVLIGNAIAPLPPGRGRGLTRKRRPREACNGAAEGRGVAKKACEIRGFSQGWEYRNSSVETNGVARAVFPLRCILGRSGRKRA